MNIVYLITDRVTNLKYIGSKRNYKGAGTYFGSPCAKEFHPKYEMQQKWKERSKTNPDDFVIEILYEGSVETLLEKEREFQELYNVVKSDEFINACYANKGFVNVNGTMNGKKHSDETKKILSERCKEQFSNEIKSETHRKGCSNAQTERWAKATDEEKRIHGEKIKESHQNMSEEDKLLRQEKLRRSAKQMHENMTDEEKAAYSEKQRASQSTSKSVTIDGKTYISLRDASRELGIYKITISRRCKNPKFTNYRFN